MDSSDTQNKGETQVGEKVCPLNIGVFFWCYATLRAYHKCNLMGVRDSYAHLSGATSVDTNVRASHAIVFL